ncbi:hypothetical protein FA15DRAFT_584096, partial [Coprinopsis marcescibilis]
SPFFDSNIWKTSPITIPMPHEGTKHASESAAPELVVEGMVHRSLIEVITSAFTDSTAQSFEYTPYQEFWKATPEAEPERIYNEVIGSDAFLEEHDRIMQQPREDGDPDDLEYSVASILLWSDSTHLASFGTASLWPIYTYIGNQSKYNRGKPTNHAAHHLAYIPTLLQNLQDRYQEAYGVPASAKVVTHLKRELFHGAWRVLLDDDFLKAHKHGIVVKCGDGKTCRLFPRFFFYSADYPEKVLIGTIQYLSNCGCCQCLVCKSAFHKMGTDDDDKARQDRREDTPRQCREVEGCRARIFKKGYSPQSKSFALTIGQQSEVPVRNAFSQLMSSGFNFFSMLVSDILHEVELGVWKAMFTHLMRVLYSVPGDKIQKLNRRYRLIPSFGKGTIRKFSNNTAAMKKLAGRNFEDLLQVGSYILCRI